MKTAIKVVLGIALLVGLALTVTLLWAKSTVSARMVQKHSVHSVEFPVPFPLSEAELAELKAAQVGQGDAGVAEGQVEGEVEEAAAPDPLAGVDLVALARERAIERGKHLVQARYVCIECHGQDFGGGTMVDDPAIGALFGPNLTSGKGGKVASYEVSDWDRIVRHGVKPDGTAAWMPAEDFQLMTDQELSDVIAYIKSVPPVDREMPAPSFGPLGSLLAATGELTLSFDKIHDHDKPHAVHTPTTEPTAAFGKHLAGVCTGCHHEDLAGGPIPGGPPDWAPARNLTPHEQGIKGWTYEQFIAAMRQGVRPDGTVLKMSMSLMMPYAQKMTDTELQALWAYLSSLSPKPTGT
jgi:mono/diheme cytochrome c family protein